MTIQKINKDIFACSAQTLVPFAVRKNVFSNRILLFLVLIFIMCDISSQEVKLSEIIINIAEDLAASEPDQEAATAYIERLYELAENPVNLNSSNEQELSRLFFLSEFQVKALADYTRSTGKIISFNELSYIPGFDKATAEMIIPFSTLSGKQPTIADSVRMRNLLITNISLKTGRHDTVSIGSPLKILTKYKFDAGNFSGGMTFEKDQGERFFSPGTISPDFLSARLAYTGKGVIRTVILGDYSARFGQGTNINTGISTGLSLTSQGYMSATNEIRQYTSTDENVFFRGIAISMSVKNLDLSLFYSRHKIDATLGTFSGTSGDYIETLYKSGTHNTSTLLLKKDVASASVSGLNISYNFSFLRIGFVWSANRFSLPVVPDYKIPEKLFSFTGETSNVVSFYYNCVVRKILLYGEMSANDKDRYALLQGLSFRPSDRLIINFLYWKYSPGYMSFNGKGPGGSSGSYPEQSLLGNFTFEAARHLFINGGCYIQHFPWLKYRCSSPSLGIKREIGIKYMPSDKLSVYWLYSYRYSMIDDAVNSGIPGLQKIISRSSKVVIKYSIQDNVTLGTRFDYRNVGPSGSKGAALLEEISCRMRSVPVSFWVRYCVFRTDDYDSRIYTWENDLLYTFTIPSLYGKGNRFYLMTAWKISRKAELRFKYGILSGSDGTDAFNNTEEFRLQLKLAI